FRNVGRSLDQTVDRGADIVVDALEVPFLAAAVAHAPVVETQHRDAGSREMTREHHELAMTADAILRAADDDHDGAACAFTRRVQNAVEPFSAASERDRRFLRHAATRSVKGAVVCSISAGAVAIS